MAIEKKWPAISPRLFTANGSDKGIVTILNTSGFKVKQHVVISGTGLSDLSVQVKRVISSTQLIVGPLNPGQGKQSLTTTSDLSAYTLAANSFIFAEEQDKANLKPNDIIQAVYRQEPGTTIGVELDDEFGNPYNASNPIPVDLSTSPTAKTFNTFLKDNAEQIVTEDTVNPANNRPLPVKLTGLDGDVKITADNLNLDTQSEGIYDAINNTNPDNIGIIAFERATTPGDPNQIQKVSAIKLADVTALDISAHDATGQGIDSTSHSEGRSLDVLTPDNTTNGTLNALNANVSMNLSGLSSVGFQIANGGDFIGTIQVECSLDGGTQWKQVPFIDILNSAVYQEISLTSPNSLQIYSIILLGGASHVRIIATAYTSGSANIVIRGSKVIGVNSQVSAAEFSQINNTYVTIAKGVATLILSANPARKYAYISNNSGNVVNIQLGSSTGLTALTGLVIQSNGFHEIKGDNLFTGDIYAYTGNNNVILSVSEGTP